MLGLWLVLQQRPRSVTSVPPSSVTLPLPTALDVVMPSTLPVETTGRLEPVSKLTSSPYAVPLLLVAYAFT